MRKRTLRMKIVGAAAATALAIVVSPAAGVGNDDGVHGDSSVPFWPHETGALVGTSETFIDLRADGSYFDPSVGRRVAPANAE